MFALIDCNNFYASCEQVFNPKLQNRPLVILSNNDGCVVARSKEAKELGIPMGAPAFEYESIFLKNKVTILSSNYALYADMSHRIISAIETFDYPLEIYSIDEAFLLLPTDLSKAKLEELSHNIRKIVVQWTGISVSVGIAPTKTLAKIANKRAKKEDALSGVFVWKEAREANNFLKTFSVEEIWGVGRKYSALLIGHNIRNAYDFKTCPDDWIRKKMTVVGLRTAMELRGISCLKCEDVKKPKKTILSSRTFKKELLTFDRLSEAIATFTAIGARKLREQESVASALSVFIATSPFSDRPYFSRSAQIQLPAPTSFTPKLIAYSKQALKKIFEPGKSYKRAGIMLADITFEAPSQTDLFDTEKDYSRSLSLMYLLDGINDKFGRQILTFAAEGLQKNWQVNPGNKSPRYTTSWDEILKIDLD